MTDGQLAAVKELLQLIELEEMVHRQKMRKRRQELMEFVPFFESYGEMYQVIRQNTPSLADFCLDMAEARSIWDRAQKGEHNGQQPD